MTVREDSFFPLEFIVSGTPASQQASISKATWKQRVRSAAAARIGEFVEATWLDGRALAISIFYFPSSSMQGDVDNIVKPILDALVAMAYPDDHVIERITVQKFEPDLDWAFARPSSMLAAALDSARPLTYIRLDDTLAWRQV